MQPLHDWHLAVGVLILVVIDLVILITYNIVAGVQGSLTATRVPNRENPMDVHEVGLRAAPSNPARVCILKNHTRVHLCM